MDDVTRLRAEVASLEHQCQTWKALVDHMRGVEGVPMLAVYPDAERFRVAMTWSEGWGLGEFGVLLATVVKHVANNAGLEEEQLLFAIDHALSEMEGETVNGGRVM